MEKVEVNLIPFEGAFKSLRERTLDKNLPRGENWHIELLSQMISPFTSIREPVMSENLFQKLKEYLKFRHLF